MSSEDMLQLASDRLNNDVLRLIYVDYVKLLNEVKLEEACEKISDEISCLMVATISGESRGFNHECRLCNISGSLIPYGTGRVCTIIFGHIKSIFRIKHVNERYIITDWESEDREIVHKVTNKIVDKFNSVEVMATNIRKQKRRWIRFDTREKFVENLSVCTNFTKRRIETIVDGCS